MKKSEVINWKVPVPFAFSAGSNLYRMGGASSGITYKRGFSQLYSSEAGQKVALGDVNGMFNMSSLAAFFNQKGGWRTFSREVSDAIGGYPEGAILYWFDDDNGRLRTVRSMKADNEDDFTEDQGYIDGSSWAFVDEIPASTFRVRMFAGTPEGVASASTGNPWTAPFDCVVVTSAATVTGTQQNTGDTVFVFLQVKNQEDEGFGTAGFLSAKIPPTLAAQSWWENSEEAYGQTGPHRINPISDTGARVVAYVSRGGQVQPMSSDGAHVSVTFTFFPLTY